jgi:hypothetical protein
MVAQVYRKAASWPQRKGGNGYMGISIGSRNHSGASLCHMIDWINAESGFSFLRIGLSDTLNRFNEAGHDARGKARKAGDAWLADNRPYLSRLRVPHELFRWDHWESTYPEAVERNRRRYARAFHKVPAFRDAMMADMESFSRRRYGAPLDLAAMQPLHDYLIEEMAVYEEIYRGYPNTTIYPGAELKVAAYLRSSHLSETFPHSKFERLYIPVDKSVPALVLQVA